MHPLLQLAATRPQLLADHAGAYADLVAAEFGSASAQWQRRAVLGATAFCCAGVAAVLAGVALMLWAVTPPSALLAPWALVAAPLLPAVVALACGVAATTSDPRGGFHVLRQQVAADLVMLRELAGR